MDAKLSTSPRPKSSFLPALLPMQGSKRLDDQKRSGGKTDSLRAGGRPILSGHRHEKGRAVKKATRLRPSSPRTLQQEASRRLDFPGKAYHEGRAGAVRRHRHAKGSGTVGLITYMRTDSTRISEEADQAARAYVASNYGENYVAEGTTEAKKSAKRIQDAHEAIRPSDITRYAGFW